MNRDQTCRPPGRTSASHVRLAITADECVTALPPTPSGKYKRTTARLYTLVERHLFECQRPHERAAHKPHVRGWVIDQVHRICDLAEVPRVTAHAMRGLLAALTAERGLAGHLIAATLGHEDERTTMHAYAAPGSAKAGALRRGLVILNGGTQPPKKKAQ